jgi:hypothetical protein
METILCERCDAEISAARIEALPDTRLCLKCSEEIGGDYETSIVQENLAKSGSLKKNYGAVAIKKRLRKIVPKIDQSDEEGQQTVERDTVRRKTAKKKRLSIQEIEKSGVPSRAYSAKEEYEIGELIAHTKFGIGRVISLKSFNKMEVEFTSGIKVLLRNS